MALKIDRAALAGLGPAERELAAAQLSQVEAAFRANPLLGYRPHPRQVEFHAGPHPPLRAFFGGNRSGKTTATMIDSILQAVDLDAVPEHLRGYRRWDEKFLSCRHSRPHEYVGGGCPSEVS